MSASNDKRPFVFRESIHILIVMAAALILSANFYQRFTAEPEEAEPEAVEQFSGMPPSLSTKLQNFMETAEELQSLPGDERTQRLQETPRLFAAFAVIGIVVFVGLLVCLIGVAVLIWYGIQRWKGRSVLESPPVEKPQWRVWEFIVVMAVLILAATLLSALIGGLSGAEPESRRAGPVHLVIVVLADLAACAYAVYLIRSRFNQGPEVIGWTGRNLWRNVGVGIVGYVCMLPLVVVAGTVSSQIARFVEQPVRPNPAITILAESGSLWAVLLLAVVAGLIIPIIEEFLFRGVLYGALRKRLGPAASIAISALVFSAFHLNLFFLLPIFVIGAVLAFVFEKTRSLVTCSVIHIIHNTTSVAFVLFIRFVLPG